MSSNSFDSKKDDSQQNKSSQEANDLGSWLEKIKAKHPETDPKRADSSSSSTATKTDLKTNLNRNLPTTDFSLPVVPLRQGILFPNTESVMSFGRDFSVAAIKAAMADRKLVLLVNQKKDQLGQPSAQDLFQIGTLAVIERTLKTEGNLSALVRGLKRARIINFQQFLPYLKAQVSILDDQEEEDQESLALASLLKKNFQKIVQLGKPIEFLSFIKLMSGVNQSEMTDQIASTLNLKTSQKQELLEMLIVKKRMAKVADYLNQEIQVLEIERDVVSKTQRKFDKSMRESVLRERLNTIKKELGEVDDNDDLATTYLKKLHSLPVETEIKKKIRQEINHFAQMSVNNPESGYLRSWLEVVFSLPWGKTTAGQINLTQAEKILNSGHYGLKEVKDRVLEYISVLQLKKQAAAKSKIPVTKQSADAPTILCFVGPPGVGKTSIGKAIAEALGRKFTKISLGGVRDEADIRGHRRTYVGAMNGRIIKGIIQAKSTNPVFILDEIDKIGQDFRGDPAAALLEVLDPEQNKTFEDHYLDIPFDLSGVIFITTANTLNTIPAALRDRLEIIFYPGYTFAEKFQIGKKHLLAKVFQSNGLNDQQINIEDSALKTIIERYTKEAGVRGLQRQLGKVCRKIARQIVSRTQKAKSPKLANKSAASAKTAPKPSLPIVVTTKDLKKYLGPADFDLPLKEQKPQIGLATGLAWTSVGGDVLFIEVALTPGKGRVNLTGKLGEVMKESAQAAFTFVKAHAGELEIAEDIFEKTDVHIHVPEGATPKDGPSAGITLATAIASAFTKRPVRPDLAMTGEITLRGRVLRIGGLKEKTIAAHLAGVKTVIIPAENRRDLADIPPEIKKQLTFKPVKEATDVLKLALL